MPHRTSRISFVLRQSSEEELLVLAKVWETCGTKSISDRWLRPRGERNAVTGEPTVQGRI